MAFAGFGVPLVLAVMIGYLSSGGSQGDPVAYLVEEQTLHGAGASAVLGLGCGVYRGLLCRAGGRPSIALLLLATPVLGGLAFAGGVAIEIATGPRGPVYMSDVTGMWAFAAVVGTVPGWLTLLAVSLVVARLPASRPGDDSHP